PMSQRKETMPIVARESGADDLLLRPLCAQNLPITKPEREGWVKRELLHDFSGRSRKPQMALANEFNFDDYAQPAGGCCFLTDESYSKKLVDLWETRGDKQYDLDDVMLLKVGRHIRPNPRFKIIVAREDGEARFMTGYKKEFINMNCSSHRGPLALLQGEDISAEDLTLAAQIIARYGQGREAEKVEVEVRLLDGQTRHLSVKPLLADEIPQEWFI
ncbi:MAG: tRNA (5-methylaminomethyl-2-thiouridylate)-methyltransferase, partial [Methylococcaceae bacterium]|nr:tRNA (5-methylaminomethyl-2-thiouridylate)-methyltransferase [Methylococcaceae bacterium]